MTLTVNPSLDAVFEAIGDFIESILPNGVVVVTSDENRVAQPPPLPGYVQMTLRVQKRLMTNLDKFDPQNPAPTTIDIQQSVQLAMQLDCYGPASGDWATILSTVFRSEYAVDALDPSGVVPLYTDAPRFGTLVAGEEQYERRWIVEAQLQYNPVVSTPQQFANVVDPPGLINVDASYPPS